MTARDEVTVTQAGRAPIVTSVPFLDRVEPGARDRLLGSGFGRTYDRGEIVIHEGDRSREVLLIRTGWLEVYKGTADGRELVIAQRGPGEVVGELSALDSLPRTASVRAATPVEVTVVPSQEFVGMVGADRELAIALLTHLADRVRQTSGDLLELGVADGTRRVCRHLTALVERQTAELGRRRGSGDAPRVRIGSQEHLGLVVGLHRSTLVKILAELRQTGVIDTGRGTVTILDRDQLWALADGSSAGG